MEGYRKENNMGAQRKAGPPPIVRQIYDEGDPKAISALKLKAAEAARQRAEEAKAAREREKDFESTLGDELREREEEKIATRLRETNEDIIPLKIYD